MIRFCRSSGERMPRRCSVLTIALACALTSQPAVGCIVAAQLEPADIKYADVVVVGRVSNFTIIRDQEFRRRMLANPNLSPELREFYEGPGGVISDYARFDVQVDEVLAGKVPNRFSVTWNNSTFGEPEKMAAGPFLIALLEAGSGSPPLRGPSATVIPNKEPGLLTVLQAPCAGPFMFESEGEQARLARAILTGEKVELHGDDATSDKTRPAANADSRWNTGAFHLAGGVALAVAAVFAVSMAILRRRKRS
jgi:hypothetical protein